MAPISFPLSPCRASCWRAGPAPRHPRCEVHLSTSLLDHAPVPSPLRPSILTVCRCSTADFDHTLTAFHTAQGDQQCLECHDMVQACPTMSDAFRDDISKVLIVSLGCLSSLFALKRHHLSACPHLASSLRYGTLGKVHTSASGGFGSTPRWFTTSTPAPMSNKRWPPPTPSCGQVRRSCSPGFTLAECAPPSSPRASRTSSAAFSNCTGCGSTAWRSLQTAACGRATATTPC